MRSTLKKGKVEIFSVDRINLNQFATILLLLKVFKKHYLFLFTFSTVLFLVLVCVWYFVYFCVAFSA
jgi:hypothetical protein